MRAATDGGRDVRSNCQPPPEENDMHIQVVNFHLKHLSDSDYRVACDGWAPAFAAVPGLLSKVWLADEQTNTYGGIYTWVDRSAMEAFASSELFTAVASNPNLADITSRDFSVLEGPSVVTSGRLTVAA
jgi:hypothetical protein